jgi:hypothetical protein
MSLTPDMFYNGENTCLSCDKPMYANEVGITYHPPKGKHVMWCAGCASRLALVLVQDLSNLSPEIAFSRYQEFSNPGAPAWNLRRHAEALRKLAEDMEGHADALDFTTFQRS